MQGVMLTEALIRAKLNELSLLQAGWDGEGAASLTRMTLDNAQQVLLTLMQQVPTPEITPNTGDTVTLEWESERGLAYMEIGHQTYSFLLKTAQGRKTDFGRLGSNDELIGIGSAIRRALYGEPAA